jgi:ribosomal protein S18 acetylase RimI-like enzyme
MEIRQLDARDHDAVARFVARIPEGDRTFFKEDVADAGVVVTAWTELGAARSIAVDGDVVVGYVALVPLPGWSSHVGEIRVIVDPDHRGRGIGRALVQYAVLQALRLGLRKMVVEVVADQEATIAMFRSLGFDPEALLKNHVRDRAGGTRDLMVLAHSVDDSFASMAAVGLDDAIGDQ